jgi:hypothetical protein
MKTKIAILIAIILIILFCLAWRKETKSIEVEKPDLSKFHRKAEKAPKSKAPGSREEKCRDVFESLTGRAYPTIRPNWLVNPKTGKKLELDGYCADLRSAFEYNGKQHYSYPNSFHKTEADFDNLIERDQHKMNTCQDYGVRLLVIPYDLKDDQLHDYIKNHLIEIGVLEP